MTEKGCDNCYYSYFDERAYPCSLCIRGIERTDQWQPSKKTKTEYRRVGQAIDSVTGKVLGETYDVPQTDCAWQNDEYIPTDLASTMLKSRFKE